MKALVVFVLVVLIGVGFVMFNAWVLSEQPTHVLHFTPASAPKAK